jgi:hypothetical protein
MLTTHWQPEIELRCRHLALQTTIVDRCMDCGAVIGEHEALTGLPVHRKGKCGNCT